MLFVGGDVGEVAEGVGEGMGEGVSEGMGEGVGKGAGVGASRAVPHPSVGVRTHYRGKGEVWWMGLGVGVCVCE